MPSAVIARITIVLAFSLDGIFGGEPYQFFLDIHDRLDSSWIQTKYDVIGTRVQCASLCYQHRDECSYFGYKAGTCYLLKDTVDRNVCSQDDCTNSGMKIYKWGVKGATTTTTKAPTTRVTTSTLPATTTKITETTSTSTTTTADIPKTTTTKVPSTTTTKVPSTTSTTEVPTSTTTTEVPSTTTTEVPSTTTTEVPSTTTTTEVPSTTTTTKAPTTTTTTTVVTTDAGTTTAEAGTTTTTEADNTTTTTEAGTTTTTTTSTTTTTEEPTTTTEGAFVCPPPPDGAELEVYCPSPDQLLREMGSKSPFFGDLLGATCTPTNQQIYKNQKESFTFYTTNGGLPINTYCPHEHQVIVRFKLCVVDGRLLAVTLDCHLLIYPEQIQNHYNKSSADEEGYHVLVTCEKKSAMQAIYFMDADQYPVVKVDFSCIKLRIDNSPEDVPATPSTDLQM